MSTTNNLLPPAIEHGHFKFIDPVWSVGDVPVREAFTGGYSEPKIEHEASNLGILVHLLYLEDEHVFFGTETCHFIFSSSMMVKSNGIIQLTYQRHSVHSVPHLRTVSVRVDFRILSLASVISTVVLSKNDRYHEPRTISIYIIVFIIIITMDTAYGIYHSY